MPAIAEQTQVERILEEFREEAATTRRVLERVPADKLEWRPHPKSMSLGQLALHIATTPGSVASIAGQESFDVSQVNFNPPSAKGVDEILAAHDKSVRDAEACLEKMTEATACGDWRVTWKDREISTKPRIAAIRTIALNHWYHHRGQLSVYLRLLDIPLPVIYGPNADESPFARTGS
jgi:uncharacterized damage-inducible protein DinB